MAEKRNARPVVYRGKSRPDRLMIGDAFRIHASRYALHNLRHLQLFLFDNLEIPYDIDCRLGSDQGELVELLVSKELIGDLDDALAPELLALQIDTDGDLMLRPFEVKYVEGFVDLVCRNVVKNCPVFEGADYKVFVICFHCNLFYL